MSNLLPRNYEGQWVAFKSFGAKLEVGFIIGFTGDAARIAVPSTKKTVTVPLSMVENYEYNIYTVEELESLLDVALMLKEIDWAKEIYKKLGDLKNASKRNK